jgi:chloride channel protein, CIC family
MAPPAVAFRLFLLQRYEAPVSIRVMFSRKDGLADFTIEPRRFALLCGAAPLIGVLAALTAKFLLTIIGLFTNLAYFGRWNTALVAPDPHRLGLFSIAIPVIGGLIVGCIARFATDKVRGHGIPEAIAAILEGGSVMQGRVALWKPVASAIAIGTGGPFGAEGPIIMTGGAVGSLFAQHLHLTSSERRTLLVCGAAAGMAAVFGAPIASVLIGVELLLFEWRPRSFVPVAIAAFSSMIVRSYIIGPQPPFVVDAVAAPATTDVMLAAVLGVIAGIVALVCTKLIYGFEDLYEKLPLHWMWWPAIGGLAIGIGGWFVPQALGVGYPTIQGMLAGAFPLALVAAILVVKLLIWTFSLSSGTSGGVLAPLLMVGAATGALFGAVMPGHQYSMWAIAGMAALLGGAMRTPLTGTLFALETTHAWSLAPEVCVACVGAFAVTALVLPRSILTERLARRGINVQRDYTAGASPEDQSRARLRRFFMRRA